MKKNIPEIICYQNMTQNDFYLLSTGQAILETLKYSSHIVWFKEQHYQRFAENAASLNIHVDLNRLDESMSEEIERMGKENSYRIRFILLTPFTARRDFLSKIIIQLLPLTKRAGTHPPVRLMLQKTPYANNPLARVKTINYGPLFFHKQQAIGQGYDDVLFYDEKNHLLEASTANIFGIKKEKIFTPPLSDLILPGVIRKRLCEEMGATETEIRVEEIDQFDFLFMTNSIIEIQPVIKIGSILFNYQENSLDFVFNQWSKIKLQYKS